MNLSILHEQITRYCTFPVSQFIYNRRGIGKHYNAALKSERLSTDALRELQQEKLHNLLVYASRNVPYYRDLFKTAGFDPASFSAMSLLCKIPALSRDDVIARKQDLLDVRYRQSASLADQSKRGPAEPVPFAVFKKKPLVRNTSSGSTGAPTVFYEDGTVSAGSWANEMRVKHWFGLNPGVSEARLVRVSPDFVMKNRANTIRRLLWNQMVLPGVNLTDREYVFIIDQLERFSPKTIWAFTSAVAGTARYMIENKIDFKSRKPSLIITWAAPLYEHEREAISTAFGCSVGNIYGMREVGHIGAYCAAGSLHVFQDSHYLETDENGELLVTFLRPSPMPFIRYRTGDIGEVANEQCACGRNLQVIKAFHGRTGEIYTTSDGRMFSPNFWCRTFMDARLATEVKRFQVIYRKDGAVKVKMILSEERRSAAETVLNTVIAKNFGISTRIIFEYPDEIAPQISGKYQMVINETKNS